MFPRPVPGSLKVFWPVLVIFCLFQIYILYQTYIEYLNRKPCECKSILKVLSFECAKELSTVALSSVNVSGFNYGYEILPGYSQAHITFDLPNILHLDLCSQSTKTRPKGIIMHYSESECMYNNLYSL